MPCDQKQGDPYDETRVCDPSAAAAPIVIATSNKPDAERDHPPGFDGLDTIPMLAVVTRPNWERAIDLPLVSPDLAEAWGTETYLFTRRLRL